MDQQAVTTILTGIGVVLALAGFLRGVKKDLASQVDKVDSKIDQVAAGAKADTTALREEFRADTTTLREELKADNQALREELKADNQALREEMRTGFAAIHAKFDMLEQRTFDLSTRLPPFTAATSADDT